MGAAAKGSRPFRLKRKPGIVAAMQYRIEISNTREGVARIHLPGRSLELEAHAAGEAGWQVAVIDPHDPPHSSSAATVALQAASANDAVWRVARAAVRAVSELTGSPIEGELRYDPDTEPPRSP
jgi:hypothetical protein